MKLLHVKVEGVGRFGTPTVLQGLGPGVNILSAANEAGKSTLFRAIRTCLFERYDTKNKDVKQLATDGLALPVSMTLGFEHEGQTYELSKSFLRSASATLSKGGVVFAKNRDADEQVWEILGIKQDGKFDPAAYGLLWVEQGQSFAVPEPTEGAASVLNSAIQQEVGTLVGGERARHLLKDLAEELKTYLTDGNKPRKGGPLYEAQVHFESIEQQRIDAERRLAELDSNLDKLSGLRADWARLADKAEADRLTSELNEATKLLNDGEDSVKSLERFITDEAQALSLREAQKSKLESLRKLSQRIDGTRRRLTQVKESLTTQHEQSEKARTATAEALAERKRIDGEIETIESRNTLLQRIADAAQKQDKRQDLAGKLDRLVSLNERLKASDAALAANGVDENAIKALDAIERDMETISLRSVAAAARLQISLKQSANITLNGVEVTEDTVRAVTGPMTVDVGGLATITVSPPAASLEASEAALAEQRRKIKVLLDRHGVADGDSLRRLRLARVTLELQERDLRAERMALGIKEASPAAEIARLDTAVRQIDAEMLQHFEGQDPATLPSPDEIAAERSSLHERLGSLRTARARCAGVLDAQNAILSGLQKAIGELNGEARVIAAQLDADLTTLPDAMRHEILAAAERDFEDKLAVHRVKSLLLDEKRANVPTPDEIDKRRNRVARLGSAMANRTASIDALREQIARLEGQVQSAGGDGLGEKLTGLATESAMARREVERHAERAATLQLLRKVVEDAYNTRREELTAPLRRHLKPFLGDVFARAELELGDGFSVSGLKRSGPESEIFDKLSRGTQEQIAVLVRLAMGAMIREKGHDVPIILDDALVFSDDARIEQMFDAINRAGRNQQVIVFTCRARSFASLGGQQLRIS